MSPTYARQIQESQEYGLGLEGVLRERSDCLFGILNGIDTCTWNPATDAAIPARYALERGQWSEAAALARHPSDFPWNRFPEAEAILVFARGLGAARSRS